jgi:cytochrome c553
MKNQIFKLTAFVILAGVIFTFSAFKSTSTLLQEKAPAKSTFEIPEDINKLLDKSCFGCHNVDAQSEDARDALLIDKLSDLKKHKLVAKLDEIASVVQDGDMPPSKFLKKYPEKALTADEFKTLSEWALKAAEGLMK